MDSKTQSSLQSSLRILSVLLLVLIFTLQAQASFPLKPKTDVSSALQFAEQELREVVKNYDQEFQQRLAREDFDQDSNQNIRPAWSLIAATRGK